MPGPHFEKYLVFGLLLFASIAFAPGERGRKYLACSHTAFRTPRACLTKDLPHFWLEEPPQPGASVAHHADQSSTEVQRIMKECLVWIWLVLIASWRATAGINSRDAIELERKFALRFPDCTAPGRVEAVLQRFFGTENMSFDGGNTWNDAVKLGSTRATAIQFLRPMSLVSAGWSSTSEVITSREQSALNQS